jgi:ribonuclease VapC
MILDTSAIIAILKGEADAGALTRAIQGAQIRRISAASYVEAGIITDANRDPLLSRRLDDLLREGSIAIEPVTAKQAHIAREAYRDFGKGRHRAGLNLGDCFAYALAKVMGEPLLFKGDDFCHTDVEPAGNSGD